MGDQFEEMRKLILRIQELKLKNEALVREAEKAEAQHQIELDHLDLEISYLVDLISELEESPVLDPDSEIEDLHQEVAVLNNLLLEQSEGHQASDEERIYLASNKRKHFHRPNCEWAAYIHKSRIEFSSHREAVEAGYRPCKTCRA